MTKTRRQVLLGGSGLAVLGPASLNSFAQLGPAPRQKLEDFVSNPAKLAAFRSGVAAMKRRKPSDPKSWFYQGAIHAVTPEAIAAATALDSGVAAVDSGRFWNQCPHGDAFNSADFLIWHRAYLYYFERILREATGDPSFSLPYWNYTDEGQRGFPAVFAQPDPDPVTQLPRNPLFDYRRELAFVFGMYELSDGVAGTAFAFQESDFFGVTEDAGLAGGIADNNSRTRGRLEQRPHDLVHFAIGGSIGTGEAPNAGSTDGLMADVATAAFDPIFWVHHSNIDRLWTAWECLTPRRRWGKIPPSAWLDAKPWYFNDVDGTIVSQSRLFYLNRQSLQVRYDSDRAECIPLPIAEITVAVPPVSGSSPLSVVREIRSFVSKAELGVRTGSGRVSLDGPYTVDVALGSAPSALGGSARNSILSAVASAPRRVMLQLEDLVVEGVTSVGYDVYVNPPEGVAPARTSPAYVGTVSLFGARATDGHAHHHPAPSVQRFDISRLIADPDFNAARIRIAIVPFDLLTPRNGRTPIRRPASIRHGAIRLLLVEGSTASPS